MGLGRNVVRSARQRGWRRLTTTATSRVLRARSKASRSLKGTRIARLLASRGGPASSGNRLSASAHGCDQTDRGLLKQSFGLTQPTAHRAVGVAGALAPRVLAGEADPVDGLAERIEV